MYLLNLMSISLQHTGIWNNIFLAYCSFNFSKKVKYTLAPFSILRRYTKLLFFHFLTLMDSRMSSYTVQLILSLKTHFHNVKKEIKLFWGFTFKNFGHKNVKLFMHLPADITMGAKRSVAIVKMYIFFNRSQLFWLKRKLDVVFGKISHWTATYQLI